MSHKRFHAGRFQAQLPLFAETSPSSEQSRTTDTVDTLKSGDGDVPSFVTTASEELDGQISKLYESALVAIEFALRVKKDGRLAFQVLRAMDAIPSYTEARTTSPVELPDDEEKLLKQAMLRLYEHSFEHARVFKTDLPAFKEPLLKAGMRWNPETGKIESIGTEDDSAAA
jgi:hypothetical protein